MNSMATTETLGLILHEMKKKRNYTEAFELLCKYSREGKHITERDMLMIAQEYVLYAIEQLGTK